MAPHGSHFLHMRACMCMHVCLCGLQRIEQGVFGDAAPGGRPTPVSARMEKWAVRTFSPSYPPIPPALSQPTPPTSQATSYPPPPHLPGHL